MSVVKRVGMFDEGYFPAYFEDTDYERRLARAGVPRQLGPQVNHENASTLQTPRTDFGGKNKASHAANSALYQSDTHHGFDPFRWRAQAWT
jgi:GT2 family glycosyltransferase